MREILSRGICKETQEFDDGTGVAAGTFVYGHLVRDESLTWIVGNVVEACEEYIALEFWIPVIPETVGQFTGLIDKNGTKIFEGDIVKYDSWVFEETNKETCQGTGTGTVYFKLGSFRVSAPKCEDDCALIDCEVIGNIHENPELLEVSS